MFLAFTIDNLLQGAQHILLRLPRGGSSGLALLSILVIPLANAHYAILWWFWLTLSRREWMVVQLLADTPMAMVRLV